MLKKINHCSNTLRHGGVDLNSDLKLFRKLFFVSIFLSVPIFAEDSKGSIYLNCINTDEFLRGTQNGNETLVIDLDKKLFSSKTAFEWKLTENNTYYFASRQNLFALVEYTLNRVSLELRYKNTQIIDGKLDPTKWSYNNYQCEIVERIQ